MISTKGYRRLTIDQLNTEGCINLLEAFVRSLSAEYTNSIYMYSRDKSKASYENLSKIRQLFLSKYFSDLTGLDGESIVRKLEEQFSEMNLGECVSV